MSEINRLLANRSAASNRTQKADKSLRKARTRTLIQAGGILSLAGFLSFCGIEEGVDLQHDIANRDKAAVLLGILSEAFERLPNEPLSEHFEQWKNIGTRILKMRKFNTLNK